MALLVFNGTVMHGQPHHANLECTIFLEQVRTAPAYRLYSIGDRSPAMFRDDERGASIDAELYEVPDEVWLRILDRKPPGLYRGPVELEDGRRVEGMLGEPDLVASPEAVEITGHGGWAAYLASR
jgi:AGZA family xanthine/uracil permease-like MFS transporter